MERLAIISHNFFRANGFHKSRSPSSPYDRVPQGIQLIMLARMAALPATCATVLTNIYTEKSGKYF